MAARFRTITYTLADTNPVSLHTILNNPADEFIGNLVVRAKGDNAGTIYWADSGGSPGGYMTKGEAISIDLITSYVTASSIFFSGTANDVLYITVVG